MESLQDFTKSLLEKEKQTSMYNLSQKDCPEGEAESDKDDEKDILTKPMN